ncbi:MAG: hypothetical protein RJA63_3214 [Pseudomonadota bacterium]|jgi:hypothetical protein
MSKGQRGNKEQKKPKQVRAPALPAQPGLQPLEVPVAALPARLKRR